MKEQVVSFEVAKLAKEKEFDEESRYYYNNKGILNSFMYYAGDGTGVDKNSTIVENDTYGLNVKYSAPTQDSLRRWLREKYKLDVMAKPVIHSRVGWYPSFTLCVPSYGPSCPPDYNTPCLPLDGEKPPAHKGLSWRPLEGLRRTYEEALEISLKKALEILDMSDDVVISYIKPDDGFTEGW